MDLNNLFKTSAAPKKQTSEFVDLLVSDDADFIQSVKDLYAIEGFPAPVEVPDIDSGKIPESKKIKHVILDYRNSNNLTDEISDITSKLDVGIRIIAVSNSDSIRLKNQVQALGAEYVLWDEDLQDLLSAVTVTDQTTGTSNKSRVAKRVLILSCKGGIGLSTVSSLLGYGLSAEAQLKTLLVDHDSGAFASDIFLGMKGVKPRHNSIELNQRDIDSAIAQTYVSKVSEKLDYLILEKTTACVGDHASTLHNLSLQLESNYNFIVDSVPLTSFEEIHDQDLNEKYHRIYLICDPSVASLRAYNIIQKKMGKAVHQVLFVQNRPAKDYMVSLENAKERVKRKEALTFVYESGLEKQLIQQGMKVVIKSKVAQPVVQMVQELTGKSIRGRSKFSLFKK
ncbi:putative ATPase [Vibrio nigripulchritudo MADA3029]|uniref:AAA family ATPase n=1 Tax=Vibrio nigripulchritudo TaxID=28173 RepID=UPI0003B1F059|nr:ATPase [Vibrio nigripulchritudo]KJY80804.1 type II secretion protein [Vibrio nigripulchritudo]CCN46120.1 putative ATPase [Vibrio nigripulchritudo MADA3020]CCN51165.1 putative ATPase [Vibrio nigripulchritudo MADA3021]CCN56861.1 putative ATPase [Vibrio nigripulchritudo MADA3029]